jgi:hypothetical protein
MINPLSVNIEQRLNEEFCYTVTPNASQAIGRIVSGFLSGIHSFTIVGTYGTGKSSFILALEKNLRNEEYCSLIKNVGQFNKFKEFEFLNIVGDYTNLMLLIGRKIGYEGVLESRNFFGALEKYYNMVCSKKRFLFIIVDEFGKILEHAANNNPEKELYFIQQFTEYVNDSHKNIVLLTTLHQNFGAYARKLTEEQRNEWTKVKGRFQEIVFVEPIEQLLYLAAEQISDEKQSVSNRFAINEIYKIAQESKFIGYMVSYKAIERLYPMDIFSAVSLALSIQRYGQNERTLFAFLNSGYWESIKTREERIYNLADVYDYVSYNFYSFLSEMNTDSMNWQTMRIAIERVEGSLDTQFVQSALKLVKTIGLLNLFGSATAAINKESLCQYAELALSIVNPKIILQELERYKIIRFANYKGQYVLFDGSDVNVEYELLEAARCIHLPSANPEEIRLYFENRVVLAISSYYKTGTPRYFEYSVTNEAITSIPKGDTDGYINLIFPSRDYTKQNVITQSVKSDSTIYVYFNNTRAIVNHLYEIEKLKYVREHVLGDNSDRVAIREVEKMIAFEKTLLNRAINESLSTYSGYTTWIYKGKEIPVQKLSDFNRLLSRVCDTAYPCTPIMKNELFNKQKISGAIASARICYVQALLNNENEEDIGFQYNKFPPEKTIYYSLLKDTGVHRKDDNGCFFLGEPISDGLQNLWKVCEEFLHSTIERKRKISELVELLMSAPIKIKQGFVDFWLPTYLLIRKQDFYLFDSRDVYVPEITREVLDILQKNPREYSIEKFSIDGVKLDFFNQYRKYCHINDEETVTRKSFIDTVKPFFAFYKRLNEYTKYTRKFKDPRTAIFRDILSNAKDPGKTFFEDIPYALGFKGVLQKNDKFIAQYQELISTAIKDMRSCYDNLIERIENQIILDLGLHAKYFPIYVAEIQNRYKNIKKHLLTQQQQEFVNRLLLHTDNKRAWYQSICFVVLNKSLDSLRDEEEERLIDDLICLFRDIEKYAEISDLLCGSCDDEVFKFDLISTEGAIVPQTYRVSNMEKNRVENLENQISQMLTGETNVDVCALLKLLNKMIK